MQVQAEASQQTILLLETRLADLRKTLDGKERSLQDLQQKHQELTVQLAQAEAAFEREMDAQKRLSSNYKASAQDSQKTIQDLQKRCEELGREQTEITEKLHETTSELHSTIEALKEDLAAKESELEALRCTALPAEIVSVSPSAAALLASSNIEKKNVLGSAAGSSSATSSPLASFAEVWCQNGQLKADCIRLKHENDRLRSCLSEICADVEARVPILQEERKEVEWLRKQNHTLSTQLVQQSTALDRALGQERVLQEQLDATTKECRQFQQETADLSRQVQTLLSAPSSDVALVPDNQNLQQPSTTHSTVLLMEEDEANDPQVLISRRLVTFSSIRELQSRNRELLRVVRQLSADASAAQAAKPSPNGSVADNLNVRFEAALKELQVLREERQRQGTLLQSLLAHQQHQHQPNNVKPHLVAPKEEPRVQANDDRKEALLVEGLTSERDSLRSQLQDNRVELTGLRAHLGNTLERLASIQADLQTEKTEANLLRQRLNSTMDALLVAQGQAHSALSDVLAAKEAHGHALRDLSQTQARLAVSEASNSRLTIELASLQGEMARNSTLAAILNDTIAALTEQRKADAEALKQTHKELARAHMSILDLTESLRLTQSLQDKDKTATIKAANAQQPPAADANSSVEGESEALKQLSSFFEEFRSGTHREMQAMQEQYEQHVSNLQAENQNLKQALRDAEDKHAEALNQARASLNATIDGQEVMLGELRSQVQSLHDQMVAKEDSCVAASTAELETLKKQLQQLMQANEQLTSQLEAAQKQEQLPSSSKSTETDHGVRGVEEHHSAALTFLRRQRDILQAQVDHERHEKLALRSQLESTLKRLDHLQTSAELEREQGLPRQSAMEADLGSLHAKLADLVAMRHANVILQTQVKELTDGREKLLRDLEANKQTLNSLQANYDQLCAKEGVLQEQLEQAKSDVESWRHRFNLLGNLNQPSPTATASTSVEASDISKHLKEQLEAAEERAAALEKQYNALLSRYRALKGSSATNLVTTNDQASSNDKTEALEKTVQAQAAQIERLNGGIVKLRQAKADYAEAARAALAELQAKHATELEQQRHEHRLHENVMTSQLRGRIAKLERQLKELKNDDNLEEGDQRKDTVPNEQQPEQASQGESHRKRPNHEDNDENSGSKITQCQQAVQTGEQIGIEGLHQIKTNQEHDQAEKDEHQEQLEHAVVEDHPGDLYMSNTGSEAESIQDEHDGKDPTAIDEDKVVEHSEELLGERNEPEVSAGEPEIIDVEEEHVETETRHEHNTIAQEQQPSLAYVHSDSENDHKEGDANAAGLPDVFGQIKSLDDEWSFGFYSSLSDLEQQEQQHADSEGQVEQSSNTSEEELLHKHENEQIFAKPYGDGEQAQPVGFDLRPEAPEFHPMQPEILSSASAPITTAMTTMDVDAKTRAGEQPAPTQPKRLINLTQSSQRRLPINELQAGSGNSPVIIPNAPNVTVRRGKDSSSSASTGKRGGKERRRRAPRE